MGETKRKQRDMKKNTRYYLRADDGSGRWATYNIGKGAMFTDYLAFAYCWESFDAADSQRPLYEQSLGVKFNVTNNEAKEI